MFRLIFLFIIAFLVGADEFLLGPILAPIAADLAVTPERVALFISAYSLPLAITAPLCGALSDRYGRLVILIPSTLLFGLASITTAFVTTFEAGITTRIITGAASGGMLAMALSLAGDMTEKAAHRAIAFVTSGLTVGIILSPGIGALFSEALSWRWAFSSLGIIAILAAIAGLSGLPWQTPHSVGTPFLLGKPLFVPGTGGSLLAMALGLGGAVGAFALVGVRIKDLLHWETAFIGMLYVGFGLLTLLGNATMPWAVNRVGSGRRIMRIALGLILLAIVLVFSGDGLTPIVLIMLLAIWAYFGGMGAPALQSYIGQLNPARRGTLMALAGSSMNLGIAASSALAASLYSRGAAWIAITSTILIGLSILALRPAKKLTQQITQN